MNILIVEDNSDDRSTLRSSLERHGCLVIEATDGLQGLDLAIHHQPDAIISNTLMPKMDGYQLLWALKADPRLTSIPFLFYSNTCAGNHEKRLAHSLGAAAFILKQEQPEKVWEQADAAVTSASKQHPAAVYPTIDKSDRKHLVEYGRVMAAKLEDKVCELEQALAVRKALDTQLHALRQELKTKQAELRHSEAVNRDLNQHFSTLFEIAPFPLLLLDEKLCILKANHLACSLANAPVSEMIGFRSGEALHCIHALDSPDGCGFGPNCDGCALHCAIMHCMESGIIHDSREACLALSISGRRHERTFVLSATKTRKGNQDQLLLALQDITEQKNMQKRLQYAQKLEAVGILAGGIAYECGKELSMIAGSGDLALKEMAKNDQCRRHIEQIRQATYKVSQLTNSLLMFNRKQSGERLQINLNEILQEMEDSVQQALGQDIKCTVLVSEQELHIHAYRQQIELAITNLASIAHDSMPQGGVLTITTERIDLPHNHTMSGESLVPGAYALLTMSDNGIGLGREAPSPLFELPPIGQQHDQQLRFRLALVSRIFRLHEGHITVTSEPEKGTTFRAYIPVSQAPTAIERERRPNKCVGEGKEVILLAEDDESVRNMAEAILLHFGYEVITAVDGEDAVRKYRENSDRISLLLFDLVMPKISGQEAYNEIRKHDPGIKVIFASGHTPEIIRQRKLVGDNALLIFKPYLPSVFLQKIRQVLEGTKK